MAVIRCKMCGGDLQYQEGMTVCECEYCGSKQTIPAADNDKKIKLFDRANRLRINCEFDKAGNVYESIIEEFPEEAEGYWGNLLCKYGIEYVDDPTDGRKVPTCHRSSFESFMDDEDFELVMENSDSAARSVYREQAKQIEEIRKGIVEVSANEQPYDIFICYKETDENGDRTLDSVLAQDVYDALTAKGYRVFFSRISLEDKLGTEYEPYIFAALNSAKIMLAFGTSYDYYNAVWVKNEWSRFLRLMVKDKSKYLIPCYKDIDAYDIPKEFAKLQAQDMGKVGAVQDLIRGIDKLTGRDRNQNPVVSAQTVIQQVSNGGPNVASLVERGNMSLEDGKFDEAIDYYNRALDIDSRSAEAYLGLFMAEIRATSRIEAKGRFLSGNYTNNRNWNRAKQFAEECLSVELHGWESESNAEALKRQSKLLEYKKEETKIQAEIERLKEKKATETYELTDDEQEELNNLQSISEKDAEAVKIADKAYQTSKEIRDSVEDQIKSLKASINSLGIFRGREKKELQSRINTLSGNLSEAERKLEEKRREKDKIKIEADLSKKRVESYQTTLIAKKQAALQENLNELYIEVKTIQLKQQQVKNQQLIFNLKMLLNMKTSSEIYASLSEWKEQDPNLVPNTVFKIIEQLYKKEQDFGDKRQTNHITRYIKNVIETVEKEMQVKKEFFNLPDKCPICKAPKAYFSIKENQTYCCGVCGYEFREDNASIWD